MRLNDPIVENMVRNKIELTFGDVRVIVKPSPTGTCDDCYFLGKKCPNRAVTICCSNGGNIFKLVEKHGR